MEDEELTDDYGNVIEPQTSSPLAVEGGDALEQRLLAHHSKIALLRQQQFEAAQRQLQQQRLGPGLSERLYALSAAFAAPQYTPGFSGMMANVMPVLAQGRGAQRKSEEEREAKLQELRNKYLEGGITGEGDVLDTRLELAKLKARQTSGKPIWSENMKQFVPRDVGVPTDETGVLNGMQVRYWTDGTMRMTSPTSGNTAVYTRDGQLIRVEDAQGKPVNATR